MLHRAVYRYMMEMYNDGLALPMRITTTIDVPAGSGLGASSALTVALIKAFVHAMQLPLGPYEIARLAFRIERLQLGLTGGMQDQYAAAFGGFNFMEFLAEGAGVIVNPLRLRRSVLNEFESALVICFSGQSRQSANIIDQQLGSINRMDETTIHALHRMKQHAFEMRAQIVAGNIPGMAAILRETWLAKKQTASAISTNAVDGLLDVAMDAGAWAGKVSGAGGGGFIMLMTDPEQRLDLIRRLNEAGGEAGAVQLTFDGAEAWTVPGEMAQ
jgi:D-glycero-alpha-D-manno-heptose-7-phosphate kinase